MLSQKGSARRYTGHCHCGTITFELTGPVRPAIMCHCEDCFRISGYSWAAIAVDTDRFSFVSGKDRLSWYRSSEHVRRGFCPDCHAHMFYQRLNADMISVSLGMLDELTDITIAGQIFTSSLKPECVHSPELPHLDAGFDWSQD